MRRLLRRSPEKSFAPSAAEVESRRTVRFFRRFRRFHGGHLKVWDYFGHVRQSATHAPVVTFSADSVFDATNPWADAGMRAVDPPEPDVLFVAGRDWARVPQPYLRDQRIPVINLVQHLRHTDPQTDLYGYLKRRAIRICVGPELGAAVEATGVARGPVVVIPDGIDVGSLVAQHASRDRDIDLLVVATKRPDLGARVLAQLEQPDRRIGMLSELLPRASFLVKLARAKIALFLPNETEGFYLPALEAMALGTLVVCPDCIGNRAFCKDDHNCLRPEYSQRALVQAAEHALALSDDTYATMTLAAMTTAREFDLARERERFLELLANVGELWRS